MTVTTTPAPPSVLPAGCSFAGSTPPGVRTRSFGWRARWAAVGAAIAVVAGTGGVAFSGATNAQITPSQTLITPCRIMDTRSGTPNVGPRSTPLNGGETYSIQVTGQNGNCNIPTGTSGVVMNVTIVGPGSNGFITVFPGPDRPTASNLNYTAGQSPTPNQVTVALNATGGVSFFASGGPVNLIADIAGYTTAARLTAPQFAQNRWDQDLAKPTTVDLVGATDAKGMAFDGSNLWVTSPSSDQVFRVDPATNSIAGTPVAVGDQPVAAVSDGTNIWVANRTSNTVTRINPTTNTVIGSPISVGTNPVDLAYDGTNIWVVNRGSNNVTRINAASGLALPGSITVGTTPEAIAFDGTIMWIVNGGSASVSRINATSATAAGAAVTVGTNPNDIAFDGVNMWVATTSGAINRIDVNTGTALTPTLSLPSSPAFVAFDGTDVWVGRLVGADAFRYNAATGSIIDGSFSAPGSIGGLLFDGTNIWISSSSAGAELTKVRTG